MSGAYYNEFDPYAAQWLRNLIAAGHIAPGDVDERSILDVRPDDLRGYTQCHFFAGIGVWSHALRRAGWADDRAVWTGSCPCQPFSSAGMARGFTDERHLWPMLHFLIEERQPPVFFGEQVASKDGLGWLDLVHADLEGTGYAVGALDTCAAGVGAPHIRQRLYLVAERVADAADHGRGKGGGGTSIAAQRRDGAAGNRAACGLGDDDDEGLEGLGRGHQAEGGRDRAVRPVAEAGESGGMEHCACDGREQRRAESGGRCLACGCGAGGMDNLQCDGWGARGDDNARHDRQQLDAASDARRPSPTNGPWRDADWLLCRDGKWRPVEPGAFPLAHGAPARVGRLRAYGNAIVAQAAAEVIAAYMECRP